MTTDYSLRIDWDADNDFGDPLEDVTDYIKARTNVTVEYGRDQARTISAAAAGRGGFELNNESRAYSPENAASPLAAYLLPGRQVLIQATVAGTTYTLFRGHTDDSPIQPDIEDKSVSFGLLDALAKIRGQKISTPLYPGARTGEAVGYVLDAVGWPTADRDIDAGATIIPWWWEEQTDAFDALVKLVNSEGPPALISLDPATGRVVFRDRHHRLLRAASTTSQATWRGSGAEPVMATGFAYESSWDGVVNDVTFSVDERQPGAGLAVVWSTEATMSLTDGETQAVRAQPSDPFYAAVTPVAGVDYTIRSGAVTVALPRDSGQATTILVTATGGPAVIDGMALRAFAVPVSRTVQVQREDTTSISRYGRRSWPNDAPWVGAYDAAAIAAIILAHRAERLPVATVRFVGANNDTRLAHMLTRALSDRVTIIEPELGLNGDFFIERIAHSFNGDAGHETVFGCERVPSQPANVFILGSATRGVLGTNVLGKRGLDDPATVFVIGSATKGVLGSNLLGH